MTKALILAAGRGSRMKRLTESQPKCFTLFQGKSLIDWQLQALERAGIRQVALVRGYLSKNFKYDLHYYDNHNWSNSNMVRSLLCASQWMKNGSIVSYSDIVYSHDAVQKLVSCNADIAITYDPNWLSLWKLRFEDVLDDAESFAVDNKNYLMDIGRKPLSTDDVKGQYMGLSYFSAKGWKQCFNIVNQHDSEFIDQLDITKLLQLLLAANIKILAVPIRDKWYEVDSESDLRAYESNLYGIENIFSI